VTRRWIPYAICLAGLPVYLWGLEGGRRVGALPATVAVQSLHYPVLVEGVTAGSPGHLRSLVERYEPRSTVYLQSGGETRFVQVVPAYPGVHHVVSAITAMLFWMVACFVFASRPGKDPGRAFFFSTFFYGLAVASGTATFPSDPHGLDALRPILRSFALALTPAFFVMMALLFPRPRLSANLRRWIPAALLVSAGAIAAWRSAVLLDYFTAPTLARWGRVAASERAIDVFVAALVGLGCLVMYHSSRHAELFREKRQLKWLWWGITVGTTPYVFLYALPHALFGQPVVPLYLTRATAFVVPIAMAVAAVRYQLLDIDIIIRRSLIYGVVAGVITAIYLLLAEALGREIARLVPGSGRFVPLAAALVAIGLYSPTRRAFGGWVDRTFFHIRHSHARALRRFSAALGRPRGEEELAQLTARFVRRVLGLKSASVVLRVRSDVVVSGGVDEALARRVLERFEVTPGRPERVLAAPHSTSHPELESVAYPAELTAAGIPFVQPLATFERLHGLVLAGEKSAERRFVHEDVELLSGIGSAAAEACERLALARGLAEERIGREQLDELNRMKSDFLSRVAHDLRTPVTSIDWSARNLLDGLAGTLNDSQSEYARAILTSAVHLGRLVTNLLEISRLEKGDGPVKPQPVDLAKVTQEAADCLMPIAASRGVRIVRRVEQDLEPVCGRREKILQVVVNLLENAIRYSPAGAEVEMTLEYGADHRQRLAVRDSGPGIRAGEEELIFERFQQGAPSPHAPTRGFGLGLYVVKAHVESFGGSVVAANRAAGGAEFVVRLPVWSEAGVGVP